MALGVWSVPGCGTFKRDLAVEDRVEGAIDRPERPGPEPLADLEPADPARDRGRHP